MNGGGFGAGLPSSSASPVTGRSKYPASTDWDQRVRVKSADSVSVSRGRHESPNPYDEGRSRRASGFEKAFVVTSSTTRRRPPRVPPRLVEADVRAGGRLVDGRDVQLLDRRVDDAEVEAPAARAEVEAELADRPPGRVRHVLPPEDRVVAVRPAVDRQAHAQAPAEAQPGAECHHVEPTVAAAVGVLLQHGLRRRRGGGSESRLLFSAVVRRPRRAVLVDPAPPVERDRALVADLNRPADLADRDRPRERGEVDRAPDEAVVLLDGEVLRARPLGVERVVDAHERQLRLAEVAEARGVPGGGGRVVGAGEERAAHAERARARAEREVLASRDVDAVGVPAGWDLRPCCAGAEADDRYEDHDGQRTGLSLAPAPRGVGVGTSWAARAYHARPERPAAGAMMGAVIGWKRGAELGLLAAGILAALVVGEAAARLFRSARRDAAATPRCGPTRASGDRSTPGATATSSARSPKPPGVRRVGLPRRLVRLGRERRVRGRVPAASRARAARAPRRALGGGEPGAARA